MADSENIVVALETPWQEPEGFAEPTPEQMSGGVVVRMLEPMTGPVRSLDADRFYIMDPAFAARLVERRRARYATDRERKCAAAVGCKWPNDGVKATGKPKAKATAKAKDAPGEDASKGG